MAQQLNFKLSNWSLTEASAGILDLCVLPFTYFKEPEFLNVILDSS